MGEQAYLATTAAMLADAVYTQGRLAEAQQLADEAQEAAVTGDFDAHAQWRAISAKLLARAGQLAAARKLADEALALIPPSTWEPLRAEMLVAKAEVLRLGAYQEARDSLRQALATYTDRHVDHLATRTRAALAGLGVQPG